MEYSNFGPEAALAFRILLYCMAYIFGGAALIGLSIYIVLLCSEILFSQPLTKTRRAKITQPARNARVAEVSLDLSAVEAPILAKAERPGNETGRLPYLPVSTDTPTTVPVTLQGDSTGLP